MKGFDVTSLNIIRIFRYRLHGVFALRWLAVLLVHCGLLTTVQGASRFWTGSVNGNFNTGPNWVGGAAPVAGDDLIFQPNNLVSRTFVTNDFSPNRAFGSVTFQGSNYFLRGNPILLTNGINSLTQAGTNHIDADVDVRASQPWEATGSL